MSRLWDMFDLVMHRSGISLILASARSNWLVSLLDTLLFNDTGFKEKYGLIEVNK